MVTNKLQTMQRWLDWIRGWRKDIKRWNNVLCILCVLGYCLQLSCLQRQILCLGIGSASCHKETEGIGLLSMAGLAEAHSEMCKLFVNEHGKKARFRHCNFFVSLLTLYIAERKCDNHHLASCSIWQWLVWRGEGFWIGPNVLFSCYLHWTGSHMNLKDV